MNVRTENLPDCQIKITLGFDAGEVTASFDKVYAELSARGQIRGFRPGKAPRALLKRQVGEGAIRSSAWYELLQEHLEKTLEELEVIGEPELPDLEELDLQEGEPAELEFTATVGPRVTLADLSDLELIRPQVEPSEEQVAEVIEQLRAANAEEITVERTTVQTGDVVDLELTIRVEGEDNPITGIEETLVVGEKDRFPPIDEQILGKEVGESVEMDITYPEDYEEADLAGKNAHITVEIDALRERKLPDLDDEFAQSLDSEKFSTFEDLRTEVIRQISERLADKARQEMENQVVKALLERCTVELPQVMVDGMVRRQLGELGEELDEMGMEIQEFINAVGVSDEQFEAGQERRARHLLTLDAILDELAKQQPEPTEDEIEAELARYAEEHDLELSFLKQAADLQDDLTDMVKTRIQRRAVFDSLIGAATVREVTAEEYAAMRKELLTLSAPEEPAEEAPEAARETAAEPAAEVAGETATDAEADIQQEEA
ncbi:MAG: trigger factor [Armatimonadetes bacterium]|nr:trigger factor [Armatimonadota bacterium]